jgi:hypothetical protein
MARALMARASMARDLRGGQEDLRDAAALLPTARASMARGRRGAGRTARFRIAGRAAKDRSDHGRQDGRADRIRWVALEVPDTVRRVQVASGPAVLGQADSGQTARVRSASAPTARGRRVRPPAASAQVVSAPTAPVPPSMAEPQTARVARAVPPDASGSPTPRGLPSRHGPGAGPARPAPDLAARAPATGRARASSLDTRLVRDRAWARVNDTTSRATCRAKAAATSGPPSGRMRARADLRGRDAAAPWAGAQVSVPARGHVVQGLASAPVHPRAQRRGGSQKKVVQSILRR